MRSPARAQSAGNNVIDAVSMISTASDAHSPSMVTYGIPASASPAVATHTMTPEKNTADPVDDSARFAASTPSVVCTSSCR